MTDRPAGAWWALVASLALMVAAYLTDRYVAGVIKEAELQFSVSWLVTVETLARLLSVAFLAGLGWLVLRGPRRRLVGVAMAIVGLYVALAPWIDITLLANSGVSLPLHPDIFVGGPMDLLLWASAVVAVLGAIEIAWPSPASR